MSTREKNNAAKTLKERVLERRIRKLEHLMESLQPDPHSDDLGGPAPRTRRQKCGERLPVLPQRRVVVFPRHDAVRSLLSPPAVLAVSSVFDNLPAASVSFVPFNHNSCSTHRSNYLQKTLSCS